MGIHAVEPQSWELWAEELWALCAGRRSPASGRPWAPGPLRLPRSGSPTRLPILLNSVIFLHQWVHMDVKETLPLTPLPPLRTCRGHRGPSSSDLNSIAPSCLGASVPGEAEAWPFLPPVQLPQSLPPTGVSRPSLAVALHSDACFGWPGTAWWGQTSHQRPFQSVSHPPSLCGKPAGLLDLGV